MRQRTPRAWLMSPPISTFHRFFCRFRWLTWGQAARLVPESSDGRRRFQGWCYSPPAARTSCSTPTSSSPPSIRPLRLPAVAGVWGRAPEAPWNWVARMVCMQRARRYKMLTGDEFTAAPQALDMGVVLEVVSPPTPSWPNALDGPCPSASPRCRCLTAGDDHPGRSTRWPYPPVRPGGVTASRGTIGSTASPATRAGHGCPRSCVVRRQRVVAFSAVGQRRPGRDRPFVHECVGQRRRNIDRAGPSSISRGHPRVTGSATGGGTNGPR